MLLCDFTKGLLRHILLTVGYVGLSPGLAGCRAAR